MTQQTEILTQTNAPTSQIDKLLPRPGIRRIRPIVPAVFKPATN